MSHAVHTFRYRELNLVYDGITNSLLTVDNLGFEIVQLYPTHSYVEILQILESRGNSAENIAEVYREIEKLVNDGILFQDESIWSSQLNSNQLTLSGMCLHVSHDCNLRCQYCFADTGPYHQERKVMPLSTAIAALDFLVAQSDGATHLDVDFFGGEPLLNFDVVKKVVQYARDCEPVWNKTVNFSLTTNGTILNDEILDFLNKESINLIVSLDGRPEVHNHMRPGVKGHGSYEWVMKNVEKISSARDAELSHRYGRGTYTYVRGTFTRNNLDFAADVEHLYKAGLRSIALEPVVGEKQDAWTLRVEDLEKLEHEYDKIVDLVLSSQGHNESPLRFHHFEIDLEDGPCFSKRATGCGAGSSYIAVTPDGELYPCHQFVGIDSFQMGTIWSGFQDSVKQEDLARANAGGKESCRNCFARYLCSGGCHANHLKLNGSIFEPDEVSCRLIRKRLECALYLQARERSS